MNLRPTVKSSRWEILPLLVLKFPKWLKSQLKTQPPEVRNHWGRGVLEKDFEGVSEGKKRKTNKILACFLAKPDLQYLPYVLCAMRQAPCGYVSISCVLIQGINRSCSEGLTYFCYNVPRER